MFGKDDGMGAKKKGLDELMAFARQGMAKEMRARHGKPPMASEEAAEGEPPTDMPEDETTEPIPGTDTDGMDANPDDAGGDAGGDMGGDLGAGVDASAKGKIDPETLKMLLAKLKAHSAG